jgi:hypothetical protein
MRDGRGDVVYDLREQVVEEVESAQDYLLTRCQHWDKDMGRVWRFLKRCAVEEAAVLLRSIHRIMMALGLGLLGAVAGETFPFPWRQ